LKWESGKVQIKKLNMKRMKTTKGMKGNRGAVLLPM